MYPDWPYFMMVTNRMVRESEKFLSFIMPSARSWLTGLLRSQLCWRLWWWTVTAQSTLKVTNFQRQGLPALIISQQR